MAYRHMTLSSDGAQEDACHAPSVALTRAGATGRGCPGRPRVVAAAGVVARVGARDGKFEGDADVFA